MKANLPQREPETLRRWEKSGIYRKLLQARAAGKPWILHDGPPYANGRVHFGTALNKTLKDFIVRSRAAMGMRTAFVPGWDCHGMPIELQVARELGERARAMPKLELRVLCRAHAERWIEVQREEFKRLGVIGDWENPYLTLSPGYEAAEIALLRKLVEDGYVYRGLRPVHWCFDCRTALAEAEVEYREHTAPSIYVGFALNQNAGDAAALAADPAEGPALAAAHREGRLFALIWTTTPWTLPANLGISLNREFGYVALQADGNFYIVATRLAEAVEKACALHVTRRIRLSGEALLALDGRDIFRHPFAERDVKLMFAEHVTAEAGTGLVHTAPGHGYEDYVTGARYGLATFTPVDGSGVFTAEAGKYAGQNVFAANDEIVADLRAAGALLAAEALSHSYPHCWRCKNPLIFRATEQWFLRIDHKELRGRALAEIDRVKWVPGWSRDRIRNMVEMRPDWCLSRQRAWGVPIPALRCLGCGRIELYPEVMKRVEEVFAAEGSDSWYSRPAADFLTSGLRCTACAGAEFAKEEDVLDVWFDSACSHAAVLEPSPELTWPADAYVEGIDQARGWFQVSLITAVATRAAAPYRDVVSHGLALDELGRKMSKSLGNFENAADVVNRIGADVFRLVFASVDYSSDMSVGESLFGSVAEAYRKIRNTCRYLLGNLADFDPARDRVALAEMLEFDRYILWSLDELKERVWKAYVGYDFQAAYRDLLNFVVVELSSLYIDVVRDRLYCDGARELRRRSAQTALYLVLDWLVRMLAPLIPFTADEVYGHIPGRQAESVHLLELGPPEPGTYRSDPRFKERWNWLLKLRSDVLKVLEEMRQSGVIGAPLEAALRIGPMARDGLRDRMPSGEDCRGALKELFVVSDVQLIDGPEAQDLSRRADGQESFRLEDAFVRISVATRMWVVGRRAPGLKCRRCWTYYDDGGDPELDARCRRVVRA